MYLDSGPLPTTVTADLSCHHLARGGLPSLLIGLPAFLLESIFRAASTIVFKATQTHCFCDENTQCPHGSPGIKARALHGLRPPPLTSFPLISHSAPCFLHSSHSDHLAAPPSPRYTTLELRSCFLFAWGPLGRLSDSVSVSLLTCQIATGGGSDNTTYYVSPVGPRPGCSIS